MAERMVQEPEREHGGRKPPKKRSRPQLVVTVTAKVRVLLEQMAEREHTAMGRVIDRMVMEAERRRQREVFEKVMAEAFQRPGAEPEGYAFALGFEEDEVVRVLRDAGLDTRESRLAAVAQASARGPWNKT